MHVTWQRFLLISLLALFSGCASHGIPQAGSAGQQPAARAILQKSAEAHGLSAFRQIDDLSAAYVGEWYALVSKLQPTLTDINFRQSSQERIVFKDGPVIAQRHFGPGGYKQVIRQRGEIQVFYNDAPTSDPETRASAALVADGYRMFLTGPFYFLDSNVSLEIGENETVEGRHCVTLLAVRRPGHGISAEDRYLLFIDAETYLLRRVRFSMEGLESTRGAIAEVDFFDHKEIAGVIWPTRFYERLRKPIPSLPVHDWRLIGLDVNRGLTVSDIGGPAFSAKAAQAARPIEDELFQPPASRIIGSWLGN